MQHKIGPKETQGQRSNVVHKALLKTQFTPPLSFHVTSYMRHVAEKHYPDSLEVHDNTPAIQSLRCADKRNVVLMAIKDRWGIKEKTAQRSHTLL